MLELWCLIIKHRQGICSQPGPSVMEEEMPCATARGFAVGRAGPMKTADLGLPDSVCFLDATLFPLDFRISNVKAPQEG